MTDNTLHDRIINAEERVRHYSKMRDTKRYTQVDTEERTKASTHEQAQQAVVDR